MEFTDRYKALGLPYPDPRTMCKGPCEGTGIVPVFKKVNAIVGLYCKDESDPKLLALWEQVHAEQHSEPCDGWHFVKCPDCDGTGKAIPIQ